MEIESIVDKVDTNKIEKLTLIGGFIFTIMGGVYFVANYLYNQRYKQKNQSYYGIPSKYFQGSIEDKVFYLILVIILICIIFSSLLLLYNIKNRTDKIIDRLMVKITAFAMGVVFWILNIKNLFDIIEIIEKNKFTIFVNNHIFGVSMIIAMFSVVGIICITYNDEIGSKLNEKWKKYFNMFAWVIFGLSFIMLIVALRVRFSYNVESKIIYETTIYEDKNMAILSDLDDKVLIVEYEINENKETILKTYNYMIVDKENLVISYKDLGEKIIVVKE